MAQLGFSREPLIIITMSSKDIVPGNVIFAMVSLIHLVAGYARAAIERLAEIIFIKLVGKNWKPHGFVRNV